MTLHKEAEVSFKGTVSLFNIHFAFLPLELKYLHLNICKKNIPITSTDHISFPYLLPSHLSVSICVYIALPSHKDYFSQSSKKVPTYKWYAISNSLKQYFMKLWRAVKQSLQITRTVCEEDTDSVEKIFRKNLPKEMEEGMKEFLSSTSRNRSSRSF